MRYMQMIGITMAGLLGLVGPVMAQQQAPTGRASQASNQQPALEFDRTEIDLGLVSDGEKKSFNVQFKNNSSEPVKILGVRASCGCTVPDDLAGAVIEPGAISFIDAEFDPAGKSGETNVTLTVASDDPAAPTQTLRVRANVQPVVTIGPASIISFGQVEKNQSKTVEVTVSGEKDGFEAIFATTSDSTKFEVNKISTRQIELSGQTRDQTVFELTLKPQSAIGQIGGRIAFRTNDPRKPLIVGEITGVIVGDLAMQPRRLGLGMITPRETLERSLTVTSRSGEPFELTGADVNLDLKGEFTAAVQPANEAKTKWTVTVSGKTQVPYQERRPVRGEVVVHTNVPGEEAIKVTAFGSLRAVEPVDAGAR